MARQWLDFAQYDLDVVRVALRDSEIASPIACFHAQQSAEKALKAVLILREIQFPFVHDLEVLCSLGDQQGTTIPAEVVNAAKLSVYAVDSRYPHEVEPTRSAVLEAFELAQCVLTWARREVEHPK